MTYSQRKADLAKIGLVKVTLTVPFDAQPGVHVLGRKLRHEPDFRRRFNMKYDPHSVTYGAQIINHAPQPAPVPIPDCAPASMLDKNLDKPKRGLSAETWEAYRQAYLKRYAVEPMRNMQVNALLYKLVQHVGKHIAPMLASYYVMCNDERFIERAHDVVTLMANRAQLYQRVMRIKAGMDPMPLNKPLFSEPVWARQPMRITEPEAAPEPVLNHGHCCVCDRTYSNLKAHIVKQHSAQPELAES